MRSFARAAFGLILLVASTPTASAETVRYVEPAEITRVFTDWQTGFALRGFDPVAYFTRRRPVPGKADFEASWRGTTWRFANAGNRAAFLATPHIYAPVSGGFDAEMALRGRVSESNPLHWAIEAGRLRLFRSAETKAAYLGRAAR